MTLTDTLKNEGSLKWIEEDQIVSVQGHVGEDIIIELKLALSENYDDLRFELIRDELPISSDRYQLLMRGNIVQLALKQSRKNDTGYYSLVATRLGQENHKGAVKKIHLNISEPSYEENELPIFLRRLSDLAVKVGTRTRFLVEIRSSTTLKIIWYKDGLPVHDGPRFSLVHEGNFHCVDVAPVTIEDQGCWTCMAENHNGRSSCTSTFTVIVPKAYKKPEFVEELRALLTEMGTVSLECKVIGVPTPVLRWFKDNKEIKAGDVFALTANPDDPTSLGIYTCEAVNCMGAAYSSSKVHVVGKGSREGSLKPADALTPSGSLPIFKQILQDECCRIGDTIVLSCRVQVPPWPTAIAWYNKEGRVESSEKYHVMEDGIGGYSIEVKQVEAMDEGEWKCVATNKDNMKQFTSCYVAMSIPRNYRKPRFMENLKAVLTEEGLVSFECKVVGFPTPLLRWFKDGQELKPGDVYQLTGTNSLGSYCCIARNCMGEAKSTAELTIEDIQNQLNEEERFQLLSTNQPPKFIKGLRSCEAKINEDFRFTVQVSVVPEPTLSWYRDDALMTESDRYHVAKENLGTCHFEVRNLEFVDQAEWKCVAANDFGHSVTSCFLKLIIPKHYKKPKFLENLRAILLEEGAVNLECKVIGVPQPVLKWYKDNVELKPGDIHRIISGQDGTCCLGIYTCEATNCMGTVSSSASLLGFEDRKDAKEIQLSNDHELARNLSLSTIHEERTSQLYDTPQTDHSVTLDERGEVSFSFDGKEVSVSLYETPDLTEEEALQIVEMYADQLSEHVTEHNVIELPPMRFVKETSTTGNLLMEAVVIDVSPDYFVSAEDNDDLRTEADFEDVSIMDDVTHIFSSSERTERDSRSSLKRSTRYNADEDEKIPNRPPRKKSTSLSSKSEKSQRIESESFHSAQKNEPPLSPLSSLKQDDSDTFADALSSAHLSITESLVQKHMTSDHRITDNRKRSLSTGRSTGSSLDDGIGGDSSFDSIIGVPKKKQSKKKQQKDENNSEKYSGTSDYERRRRSKSEGTIDTKIKHQFIESVEKTEMDNKNETEAVKELFTEEKLLGNLKSVKESNSHVSEKIQELKKDVLLESRIALRSSMELFHEKVLDTTPQFSNIYKQIDNMYQLLLLLEESREIDVDIETNLEISLRALLREINEITSTEHLEIIRNILEPFIVQLSCVIENFGLSLQPTLAILKKFSDRICNISRGTKELSSRKSIFDESQKNISEAIINPLINIQSMFNGILDYIERSKLTINGSTNTQPVLTASSLIACLIELRECVSHTTHTAMTLRENETLNSLMEFREPLLDLQLILTSQSTFCELSMIKEINLIIVKLKSIVTIILNHSENYEIISRVEEILKILEDTDKQISKLGEQLLETKAAQKYMLKNINIDQSLSNVHFALSSVLEKQEKYITSYHLITSIEALRQTIGSSAVTIANLKNPTDDEITQEINKLNESLLNLQRDLLTEKHEPRGNQVLNDLMNPISILKKIVYDIIESKSSIESIVPMLELLEDIEKDITLTTKEISKKKCQEESTQPQENTKEKSNEKSNLASQIGCSLDPIKNWLSATSEASTKQYKDEIESVLSSTIEELKRNVSQIVIQTSYSETSPCNESLINALSDLQEPLIRLKNVISIYHEPKNLSILKNLDYPMKYLLQTITNVLREHTEEESLQSITDIIEQIKNQISLLIKDTLYQELEQNVKAFNMEEKEEAITASRETIPGILMEIASTPLETGSTLLLIEQAITENNFSDVILQTVKNEKQEREEGASKLIIILSKTLEKLQLEITSILEDFEESTTQTSTIPQSKLANSIEELRRTISTVHVMTVRVYGEETDSFEKTLNRTTSILTNIAQPLTNIRNLLSRSHEHDVSELMILNRFTPLLNIIENNVIRQIIDFIDKDGDVEKEFKFLLCMLKEIKTEIPIVIEEISLKRQILEYLWDISKPLESILECMSNLKKAAEETLETDVANILGEPIAALLEDIKITIQEVDTLDRREPLIFELQNFLEPLLEFHSCLSMVQSSRKSLVPEASLLDERRSVILRAVDGLRKQVCHTIEAIANMEKTFSLNKSLTLLNSAILQVQKQIGKTDYSRRSSSRTNIALQHRLIGTLNRLDNAIIALEKHADKSTHGIVSKCLEALQKQISSAQTQFSQIDNELIDEEAVVEGFLYPTNQLLSALNILKENTQEMPSTISHNLIIQFQELADSISELSSSLLAHKTGLVQKGASEGVPIVETFSAVIDVLDHVKDSINIIKQTADVEQQASMIITKVESVIDEIVEVSQEKIESVTMITEIPSSKTIVQEVVQSETENTSTKTQIPVLENLETVNLIEQTMDGVADIRKCKDNRKEDEKQKHLTTEISKFNFAISNLTQPLKELINFVKSTKQESLISKSEEDKRKIQELTALIQILNDLQVTIIYIKTVISSLSIVLLDSHFSRTKNILADFEQTVNTIISLTHEGVKPELKENIMASLPFISKPLDALENVLVSICQTIDKDKYTDKDGESSSAITKSLISCIDDIIKFLNEMQISKYVNIVDERETEISKIKEETKDIEKTTARPLEELIEAIMESQEQVKYDKTSLESSSPFTDTIELKSIDNLEIVETELNRTLAKKIDGLIKQDAKETSQQTLTSSLESNQTEELLLENIRVIKSVTEEVKEHSLATIDQQKSTQISVNSMTQEEQILEFETLQAIISSLQALCKLFNEIGEMKVLESFDKKTAAFSDLVKPLLNLQLALPFKVVEDIKQNTVTLLKSVVNVLEELQKSIATIQEQIQLNVVTEANSSEIAKIFLVQAVMTPLEDLRMSITRIQSDPINHFIQQEAELSNEQITILQNLVKSVVQFGERFMFIISQIKIETVSPLKIKQKDQELAPEILHKIVDPIHILRETFSQIKNLNIYKPELLEMPEQKEEIAQLGTVIDSLEKLESLIIGMRRITIIQEEVVKELGENQNSLANANLKSVLKDLRNSIIIVQKQTVFNDIPALTMVNEALENLKVPLTTIEEVIDHVDKITETEKVSILLSFANSIEEIANQLISITKQDIERQAISETFLLKTMTISIEELQSAILKLEDRISQTLEAKKSIKVITLEYMIQPLQELQQSFLTASYQETVLALQRLPIKPILDNLNKSVVMIQDQITVIQNNLLVNTDDSITLKDFAKSLDNLRTSMVVLQQLNAIENANQQTVKIENACALQAFAKSIEEFRKCCSVIVEQPRIIEAFMTNIELKQSNKIDTHLIENIIVPLQILQEQILTIEETKTQESEILDVTEVRKSVIALSSLVSPLQQLEKSFVATVQKEYVIEHDGHNLIKSSSVNLEKLALQPILEEIQKSIATIQEYVILEAGSQITSEVETNALLKSIEQPLVDLKTSIASIQQVAAIAPDFLNELVQQQNISTLETFAETLHNLTERIAMCNHQQIIIEPAADTISEDASSLNTWADVIDESSSKIMRPMVIDQGAIEFPVEIAVSMSENETSMLKTLAKPLTELRECLALIVEEQKTVPLYDMTCSLSEKENISLMKTMIQPLLELKHTAAIIIQEQMAIEHANEHLFAIDGKNEFILRSLIEPLEELQHSIAVIQDHMLLETPTDRSKNDVILNALAEPLFDLQRAISVLETRVISPDVESMPEDADNNWIKKCLATPLHEIERSIADIRQCNIMEPETITVEEQARTLMLDWSIIEKLAKLMKNINSAILRMENDSTEIEILKTIEAPLTNVQENLMLLRNKFTLDTVEDDINAFIESLSHFEKYISFAKKEIVDKVFKQLDMKIDTTISATLNISLTELKCSIETIKTSPSVYLNNLEKPLELMQNALETVVSIQRNKKLSELSMKIINNISDINKSIESIGNKLKQQQLSAVEIYIEYEALGMLTKSLQNIKQCIIQIQEKPNTANLMISALQRLEKSIAIMREQSADKPLAEPHYTNFGVFSKNLIPCLYDLQESIDATKTLWCEETVLDGLMIFEKSIYKLLTAMNTLRDESLEETISIIDEYKIALQKKSIRKEIKTSEIKTAAEKEDKINKIMEEEIKLVKDTDSSIIYDAKEDKKIPEKMEQRKEKKDDEKLTKLTHEEEANQIENKNEKRKKKNVIQEMQKVNKEQESKETKQLKEEAEQSEESIKEKKLKRDEKEYKKVEETNSIAGHKEAEKIKEIQGEKISTKNVKNEIEECENIIDAEKMRKEKNEQKIERDVEKKEAENDKKKEQETVKEKRKIDECKRTEMTQSNKEKINNKKTKDTGKKEAQSEEKKGDADKIGTEEEQKNMKDINKSKSMKQYERKDKEKEEENRSKEKEIDRASQKKQESVKIEEVEMIQKEKDKCGNEAEAEKIEKNIEQKNLKEDKKLEKEQKNLEDKESALEDKESQNDDVQKKEEKTNLLKKEEQKEERKKEKMEQRKQETKEKIRTEEDKKIESEKVEEVEKEKEKISSKEEQQEHKKMKEKMKETAKQEKKQKKEKIIEEIKEEESEKTKDQKIEKLEKKNEKFSIKKEYVQEKIKEQEQKEQMEEIKKQEEGSNKEVIVQVKEEESKESKSEDTEKLKRRKEDSNKKGEIIKQEEQKKKNEEISRKEDKERKEATNLEEIKIAQDKQTKTKTNVQENKNIATQERDNIKNKIIKSIKQEEIEKKKDEIVKMEKIIQQTQYTNNIKKEDDTNESRKEYKEINEDQKQKQITRMKQKQKEKANENIQALTIGREQQEKSEPKFEELERSKKEDKWKQRKPQSDENWLFTREERVNKSGEYRVQKKENDYQERDNDKRLHRIEKRIRRDETAILSWAEKQILQKKQEEERFKNKQRRKEQIRENESDHFLRNIFKGTTFKLDKSTSMVFDVDYSRGHTFRFDSSIPLLSNASRSYSWRASLSSSLRGKRFDDYWDYKLHSSMDKYYFDVGSLYRRRRKRENRMIRARSVSLLKDYSTGDSDAIIVSSTCIQPFRRTKVDATSRINTCESNYIDLRQSKNNLSWDKPKKPSFCTRLTNRIIGVGMRIRLTCTVLGNPEPRIYWIKDDQKLDASDNRCRMRYENGMAYLELHNVLSEDAGIYTCVAENIHGTSTTESILRVYSDYKSTHSSPIFVKSIKDTYRYSDRKLILECRVRAHPIPMISWLKDGMILQGERYRQSYLDNDVCRLEIANFDVTDNGQYTCRAGNELHTEEISHIVHVEDLQTLNRNDSHLSDEIRSEFARGPRFSNLLKNYSVPTGGTIALQVEVKGIPSPEVKWLRGDRKEPIAIPKARTFVERGLYTLIVPEVTESEKGIYVCRAINAYGQVDTSATVDVISSSAIDGGKPAVFVSRPSKKSIDVIVGEDISTSFRVSGIPKPRIIWMKGLTDITNGPRSYKESIDDYVRLILKRVVPSDEGTYCILVKNRYGCDRSFFSIKVKQRPRSLTPLSDWNSVTERDVEEYDNDTAYVRNVPGPISSEPVVIDGGKSWLSLSWGKAERRGPAPVVAYKVEAWLLGGDGGARWVELGITPLNAFDAFNLQPGGEYIFRVTPRNRYGWGESVTMTNSVLMIENTDLPEFTKILPGQLKVLEGTAVKLECEIRGDSKTEVRWYRETTEINPYNNTRFAICYNGSKCSLTITNIKEDDSGRYVCEANNRIGKVSSFARILVVTDPRIIEADAKLKTSLSIEPEDRPPQFTMRIRDRRVQTTYPVRLTCQVIGYPIPEIAWYKNGTEIFQDERHIFWDDDPNFHTLEIIHSALEDSGCYMVTARNINGSVSCRCTLVVDKGIRAYIAPEFLRGLNAAYTIHSGGELQMSAQLEAYPSVGIVWHRDGIRLRPSRRAVMTLSHDGTVQFCLANITTRDAGVYGCTATNVVGQTETSTRVTVTAAIQNQSFIDESSNIISISPNMLYSKEPLFITKPLSTEAIEGDTVIILCEVVGDPKPEVIWLRDFLKPDYYRDASHFRLVGAGPQYRLEIPYAKLDFTGTYSVIARNCHGEAKAVISLQIYAKGQDKEEQRQKSSHGKVLTLPIIKRELRDLRCCDGDAASLECKIYATQESSLIRWERGGKIITMVGDFAAEFDGETARLNIQHVYPEDEGEYTCVAYNDLGKAYTSACLVVDVPEGKENILSQRLTRPMGLLSAGSTPRSTPRSTPIRSLSPAVSHGREFRSPQVLPRSDMSKRPRVCPPKFYAVPHNRLVQEGETVRFQCAVVGYPTPWIRWDKNGTIVTPCTRISIKERDDIKILEIIDVMREDAALYRVTAENDFGQIEASARLEVINRYESTSRTIRTRSSSPRTYPSFDRNLLPTTSRINSCLQLECRVRGTPSVTSTWYRNRRPLERSSRIKRYFDGTTARIEISKVKASDAGEYTCVATNILGSTRTSCQVAVLDPYDLSIADKSAPRFLQSLPKESIVMENYCHEFQVGVTGTPPFTITWFKDGRKLPDSDYYKYVIYGDGGIALRISEVHPQDAGEYICTIQNDFGIASCNSLFAVQDYKDVFKPMLQFTKTPLSVIAAKGTTVCFCARAQCRKTIEIIWTINGKDARENAKCKIERDGNVSILRIRDVSLRNIGEVRCIASMNGKGLSISCIAKLQLQNLLYDFNDSVTKLEGIQSHAQTKLSLTNINLQGVSEKMAKLSSLKCRHYEKSLTRIRSSSFPRCITSCTTKLISPLPIRKRISDNALIDVQRSQFGNDLPIQKIIKKNLDSNLGFSKIEEDQGLSYLLNEKSINDISIKLLSPKKMEQLYQNIDSNKEYVESRLKELIKATIIKAPTDISVFRGSRAVLKVIYHGCPKPTVNWLQVNRELQPGEKIGIVTRDGVSYLILDDVTYNHAGKYEVLVENPLGKDRRFFSLAVEGPPEPLTDKPSVNFSAGQTTIVWRSPPYDGGRTVIGYTVEAKRAGESRWIIIAESSYSLSHTIATTKKSVIPGESYYFRIRAENIHGLSDPGMESDLVKIPNKEEKMLQEEEDEFKPSFEAHLVIPEEGKFFDEKYDVFEELGKGRYGVVKKVIERLTGMTFAAKFVKTIKAKDREQVREEIKIMNTLRHPKLLLLTAAYESPRETVLITEYISGGELFERVVADDFTLTEKDSILFIRQICQGVEYMHQNKIVHLDLKPENIMCHTRTSHQIKLIDFGLAQTLKSDTPIRVLFGTPEFIPPEIISYEPIGIESDMWSVGVICYVLLTGLSPFMGDNDAETFANITRADYDLEDEAFDAISNDAKNFISGLLIKRKELRMSATQCLEHPWMAQHATTMSRVVLPTEKLKKFIIRRKWQLLTRIRTQGY